MENEKPQSGKKRIELEARTRVSHEELFNESKAARRGLARSGAVADGYRNEWVPKRVGGLWPGDGVEKKKELFLKQKVAGRDCENKVKRGART